MAIVAHAQHQHVDGWKICQCLVGAGRGALKVLGLLIQANEARFGRRALEQVTGQQAGIAVGMLHRHPALIGQAHGDLRPVQRLGG
ncbi:hypothetical protein D3C81_1798350 [compost metagenome]